MEESFEQRLPGEVAKWRDDGLIDAMQAAAIQRRYGIDVPVPAGGHGSGSRAYVTRTLAVIGAILVGLGVILFFASNWHGMSREVRMVTLLVATVGAYMGGIFLRERAGHPRRVTGAALVLLGTILFGASIFLVGQTYNVQAHDPLAMLLWSAGAFGVAATTGIAAVGYVSVLTLLAWIIFEASYIAESGTDIAPVMVAAPMIALGTALYLVGTAIPALRTIGLAGATRQLGLVTAGLATFALTFDPIHDPSEAAQSAGEVPVLLAALMVVFLAAACAAALLLALRRQGRGTAIYEAAFGTVLAVIAVVAGFAPALETAGTAVFNIAMAVLALGALIAGYVALDAWLVAAGAGFVVLDVFARYFDLTLGLMPRSLVFVGAGVLLLIVGYVLERGRGELQHHLRGEDVPG